MKPSRPPLTAGFVAALVGGFVGTCLFALGALVSLEQLPAPHPVLDASWARISAIALGLVLMSWEVRAIVAFARARRGPPSA